MSAEPDEGVRVTTEVIAESGEDWTGEPGRRLRVLVGGLEDEATYFDAERARGLAAQSWKPRSTAVATTKADVLTTWAQEEENRIAAARRRRVEEKQGSEASAKAGPSVVSAVSQPDQAGTDAQSVDALLKIARARFSSMAISIRIDMDEDGEWESLQIVRRTRKDGVEESPMVIRVLFLGANAPPRLSLDDEVRGIRRRIESATHSSQIQLVPYTAVRGVDFMEGINRHDPTIVHISGHAGIDGMTVLKPNGRRTILRSEALLALLRSCPGSLRLVLLNGCDTHATARAVADEVGTCAIGMLDSIDDGAAVEFVGAFYSALAHDRSVGVAYGQGKASILVEDLPDDDVPALFSAAGVNPDEVYLLRKD